MAAKQSDSGGMSPLARLIRQKNSDGLSYREMERQALLKGHRLGSSSFEQIASDGRARPLSSDTIRAIAAGVGESPQHIAELDAERHGLWGKAGSIEAAIEEDRTLTRKEKQRLRALVASMREQKPPPARADSA